MTPEPSAARNANSADEMYQRVRLVALALVLVGALALVRCLSMWLSAY